MVIKQCHKYTAIEISCQGEDSIGVKTALTLNRMQTI